MLRIGDSLAHRALGYVSRFLAARSGAPLPATSALAPGEAQHAFTPASAPTLYEFEAICAALPGAAALLGGSAVERSEVVECLHVFQPPAAADALRLLEARLAARSYVAGARLSVADALVVYTTVPALAALAPARLAADYPQTVRWLDQLAHEAPQLYAGEDAPPRVALPPQPTLQAVLASVEAAERSGEGAAAAAAGAGAGAGAAAAAAGVPAASKKDKKAGAPPPTPAAPAEERSALSEMDFGVGRIVEAWAHPDSDKLWCEKIAFGEGEAVREIASGLRAHYTQEQMVGQRVVVVRNLKSRKVAGFASNGMVLCASGADGRVEFVVPPEGAREGERVTFEGHGGAAAEPSRVDKKKVRECRSGVGREPPFFFFRLPRPAPASSQHARRAHARHSPPFPARALADL